MSLSSILMSKLMFLLCCSENLIVFHELFIQTGYWQPRVIEARSKWRKASTIRPWHETASDCTHHSDEADVVPTACVTSKYRVGNKGKSRNHVVGCVKHLWYTSSSPAFDGRVAPLQGSHVQRAAASVSGSRPLETESFISMRELQIRGRWHTSICGSNCRQLV